MQQESDPIHAESGVEDLAANPGHKYRWYQKLFALLAVIFCFEVGIFLVVFPWVSDWDLNYFSAVPFLSPVLWASPYFRGAISGLGVLNIYISFTEVFRLRRFSS